MSAKQPTDIKMNTRWRVVEGLHDGKEGLVVGHEISSFGFVWVKIKLDNGEVISTRWTDVESISESEEAVS